MFRMRLVQTAQNKVEMNAQNEAEIKAQLLPTPLRGMLN